MDDPGPVVRDLSGRDYLDAVTALLLQARSEDPMAGLYEAGDLQWWWKDEDTLAANRSTFWCDAAGEPIACLLLSEWKPTADGPGGIDADLIWRPGQDALVRAQVFPTAVARLAALPTLPDQTLTIVVDERDGDLRRRLEGAGFRRRPDDDMVQLAQRPERPPDPVLLSPGFRFDDERSRPRDGAEPHHLAQRNGARVAERLRECSLYRPDLDLCVQAATGEVAAYCLCWLDSGNRVGLFEPVRTEDAFHRRGLGRAMMTEGIRRLMAHDARLIKVTTGGTNDAARRLYEGVGFVAAFAKLSYERRTGAERSPA